jgi:hypothetical protein
MRRWIRVTASILSTGALVVMAAPWAAATTVSSAEWRSWLVQQQASFVERTRPMSLAVDQRIVGDGEMAQASVAVTGIVNADGSMRVDLASATVEMTVVCTGQARCWARLGKGGDDRLWHRIPAREMASLRDPLPTQDADLPAGGTYTTEGSTGAVDLTVDDVIVLERVSFADGAYTEALRLSDASEGVELTLAKSLTPTAPLTVRVPSTAAVGSPLGADVIPQLP